MNSMIIESSRQNTEGVLAGGIDATSSNAQWTTTLKQAVQLQVGDRVSVPTCSINAVGNQSNTIEITGQNDITTGSVDNTFTITIQPYKSLDGQNYDIAPVPRSASEVGTPPNFQQLNTCNYINSTTNNKHCGVKATRMNYKKRLTTGATFSAVTGATLQDPVEYYTEGIDITLDKGYLTPVTICNSVNQQLQKATDLQIVQSLTPLLAVDHPALSTLSTYIETPCYKAVPSVPMTEIKNVAGEYSGFLNKGGQEPYDTVDNDGAIDRFDDTIDYQVGCGQLNTNGIYSKNFDSSGLWKRGTIGGTDTTQPFLQGDVRTAIYTEEERAFNLIPDGYKVGEYKYLNDPFMVNPEFNIAGLEMYNHIILNSVSLLKAGDVDVLSQATQVANNAPSVAELVTNNVSDTFLITNMLWDGLVPDVSFQGFLKGWLDSEFKTFLPSNFQFSNQCMIQDENTEPSFKFIQMLQGADGTYNVGFVGTDYCQVDTGLTTHSNITAQAIAFDYSKKDTAPSVSNGNLGTYDGATGTYTDGTPAYGCLYKIEISGVEYVSFKIPKFTYVANRKEKDGDLGVIYMGKNLLWSPSYCAPGNTTIFLNNGHPKAPATQTQPAGIGAGLLLAPEFLIDGDPWIEEKLLKVVAENPALYMSGEVDLTMVGAINPQLNFDTDNGKFYWSSFHTPTMIRNGYNAGDTRTSGKNVSGTVPAVNNGTANTLAQLHNYPRPYGVLSNDQVNSLAGTPIWTTHYINTENNLGLNLDCYDSFSFNTEPGYFYDNNTGVFVSDWGFTQQKFQGSSYDKMGFTYFNLNNESQLHGRNVKAHTKRKASSGLVSNPPTSGALIDGKTSIQLSTGRFNLPIYSQTLPRMCSSASYGAIPTGMYNDTFRMGHPNIVAESTQLVGYNLPTKSDTSFFTICSTVGEGNITYLGGRSGGEMLPVVAVVSKYYSGSDYFFSTDPSMSFMITKPTTISSITTEIRTSSGTLATNINGRSTIIYKIDRVQPPAMFPPPTGTSEPVPTKREKEAPEQGMVERELRELQHLTKDEIKENIGFNENVKEVEQEQKKEQAVFSADQLASVRTFMDTTESFQASEELQEEMRPGRGRRPASRLTEAEKQDLPENPEAIRALEDPRTRLLRSTRVEEELPAPPSRFLEAPIANPAMGFMRPLRGQERTEAEKIFRREDDERRFLEEAELVTRTESYEPPHRKPGFEPKGGGSF